MIMTNTLVSFGKNIVDPNSLEDFTIEQIADIIKSNVGIKNSVERIRSCTDKKERQEYKKKLPYVLWSGSFHYRKKDGLKKASGLACLDFDDYTITPVLRKQFREDPYVFMFFTSPSGGLKVLIKIPEVKDDIEFKMYYSGLLNKYSDAEADESTKDICRACFLSYDPEIYINEESLIFDTIEEKKEDLKDVKEVTEKQKEDIKSLEDYNLPKFVAGISVDELKNMLNHIPSHKYSDWVKVGLTLRGASDNLFPLFLEWSKSSPAFESDEDCLDKWKSYERSKNPYGFLPLIKIAKENGYVEDERKVVSDEKESTLIVKTISDYDKLEKNTDFIVDGFLYPANIVMLYSPPAQFKSIISLYMAICIANGIDFYKFPTKRKGVLYFDGENSDQILKTRIEQIRTGISEEISSSCPLYFSQGGIIFSSKGSINYEFVDEMYKFCEDNNIEVIIMDTLHRFAYYDENKSDDINKLYTEVFKPLQQKGITVLFLHHSTKDGDYRGSGDFLGMVDSCYNVSRINNTDRFVINNRKSRNGEMANIYGDIYFSDDEISITFKDKAEQPEKAEKLQQLTNKIELIIHSSDGGIKRKDIFSKLDEDKIEYSTKTAQRALNFLIQEKGTIDKTKDARYFKK